jgi:hypothetical protein
VASTTSSKARSKKKTKKKLNISNVRARFFNSVLKHARQASVVSHLSLRDTMHDVR